MTRFADLDASEREMVETLLHDNGLLPADRDTELLVVHDDRELIGCVGFEVHGPHGLLRSLAVALRHRGRGHGRTLVRDALAALRARDVTEVWLLTLTAAPWFAGLGFEVMAREEVPEQLAATTELVADQCRLATCMRLSMAP